MARQEISFLNFSLSAPSLLSRVAVFLFAYCVVFSNNNHAQNFNDKSTPLKVLKTLTVGVYCKQLVLLSTCII
mgnify:CR=1 FL=1